MPRSGRCREAGNPRSRGEPADAVERPAPDAKKAGARMLTASCRWRESCSRLVLQIFFLAAFFAGFFAAFFAGFLAMLISLRGCCSVRARDPHRQAFWSTLHASLRRFIHS